MFRNIKLYRKKFILYLLVLLSLCVVFSVGITEMILQSHKVSIDQNTQRAFERLESDLGRRKKEMEIYVQRIYSNPKLLKDLLLFMDSNAEIYHSKRLNCAAENEKLPSIVGSIEQFNSVNSDRLYKQICVASKEKMNIIDFQNNEIHIDFLVSSGAAEAQAGIIFTRSLVDTTGKMVGNLAFLLDPEMAFSSLQSADLPNAAICDMQGNVFVLQAEKEISKEAFWEISALQDNGKTLQSGNKRLYYTAYTSAEYGYRLICVYDTNYLVVSANRLLLTAYLGIILVFCAIMLLVSINMRHEATFLNTMLDNIRNMETGHFKQMENRYASRNEYGVIAGALNDMGEKLEKHIQTEYLLKLKQQETEMIALQHQINPHFLYNTLEIIRSAAIRGNDVGSAIASLGKMYRNMVSDKLEITMEEEMALLNSYLEIMEFRNKGNFCYQTEMEDSVKAVSTVKFWMQPIAENFFLHGYHRDSAFNLFVLSAYEDETVYRIELVNNGTKIADEKLHALRQVMQGDSNAQTGESVGLKNVYARLRYYYGSRLKMEIENNEEAGITIRVNILKESSDV